MGTYMVERYLPGVGEEELHAAIGRVQAAAAQLQAEGPPTSTASAYSPAPPRQQSRRPTHGRSSRSHASSRRCRSRLRTYDGCRRRTGPSKKGTPMTCTATRPRIGSRQL